MKKIQFQLADALEKVFPDRQPREFAQREISIFLEEQYSFQIAYYQKADSSDYVNIHIITNEGIETTISKVEKVPSNLPAYPDNFDDNYITTTPGLLPDLLLPAENNKMELEKDGWNALWVDLKAHSGAGLNTVVIKITDLEGKELWNEQLSLWVIPHSLPKQKLIHTEWFHTDCLADYYGVGAFSDEHWRIVENFIKTASENGINMILTPVFTPPLDTEVGGERTTVQLVKITYDQNKYHFDFSLLKKWLEMCKRNGIQYIEIAHLFTQWGAEFAPKIIVKENGEYIRKFGWDIAADSELYKEFLAAFLPALTEFLRENWDTEKIYFHISDEPNEGNVETYKKAKEIAEPYLEGFHIIDALSDYSFYKNGIVRKPVVANSHIDEFIKHGVPKLWTYYCCGQTKFVSNRFMAMPSARTRIIGTQLFKYDIEGFLHWGYNFYNSQLSKQKINPFEITDAINAFPSGDAFLVYPGENGTPLDSIRLRVFAQALQDLRAFQWLAELKGKQYVIDLMEKEQSITFSEYPIEADYLLDLREVVNEEIAKVLD